MGVQLAYSFHLGRDKNKSKTAKEKAKENVSGTTSYNNNGIQNATRLSKVNKHNLRDYDNNRTMIKVLYGSYNLYKDVQNLYIQEFEQARIEYNEKQTRNDRKIDNYFKHISKSKLWDLACEFIIELGDRKFWADKEIEYRKKMADVFREQLEDFKRFMPNFKLASAVVHFEEESNSPHLHIVGVPVKDNCARGMKKQVAKSKLFTKQTLSKLQDEMRICCIKSYNKIYNEKATLKDKKKGRNRDFKVKEMDEYAEIKRQLEQKEQKLANANKQTKKLDNSTETINDILDNLKPTKLNKNNMVISNEDIAKIKNYTKDVKDVAQTVRNVNDLNLAIKDFEHSAFEIRQENVSLKNQLEQKENEIKGLKSEISLKNKIINKLRTEKESIKQELKKFKGFWHSIMSHFHKRITYEHDENYKIVSDDLYKNGIFTDDENEIANNIYRKVKPKADILSKKAKKKNDYNLG